MLKKSKEKRGIIILIVAFLATSALLFSLDNIVAQSINEPPPRPPIHGGSIVFLNYPETEDVSKPPDVWGTTPMGLLFENVGDLVEFSNSIEAFNIYLYPQQSFTVNPVGQMHIIGDPEQDIYMRNLWRLMVDTNDFYNGQYYVGISVTTSQGEIGFVHGYDDLPFGPIEIRNSHRIIEPMPNAELSGQETITALINGSVENVIFDFYDSKNILVEAIQVNDPDNPSSQNEIYTTVFDSTLHDNGQYIIYLSYTTLSGNYIPKFNQITVSINNSRSSTACTNPLWECDPWPTDCPSSGVMTRQCVSTNCDPQITQTESQDCTFVNPNNNCAYSCGAWSACTSSGIRTRTCTTTTCETVTEEQTCSYSPPVNQNDDENDADLIIPPNDNSATPSTQTPLPEISMQYPGQGDVVSGDIVLKAITDINVAGMEFLYKTANINLEEFIGMANRSTNNSLLWQRVWNTDQMPSGQYYVFARATLADGRRNISDYIVITIDHETADLTPDSDEDVFIPPTRDISSDTDGDGIDDITENSLQTDPNKPETKDEYQTQVDKAVTEGKITQDQATKLKTGYFIEQPKTTRLQPSSRLKIAKIENISPSIGKNNLVISGIGPANTVLKLYIYSDPIVVTTRTDDSGNFTYTLDKDLLDGEHEVYVTINDDTGKITEQSSPLAFFIRRAQAVTEEEYLRGDVNIESGNSSVVNKYVIPAAITVVALILIIIGIFLIKRKQKIAE